MIRRASLLVLIIAVHLPLFAGGPVYSRYGVGDILWFGSSRALAMGGLGYALRGEGAINIINPAGLSGIRRTRFDGSFSYNSFSSSNSLASSPYWDAGVENVTVAFPIDTSRGIVMSLEGAPYSRVGYNVRTTLTQSGVVSTQSLVGAGGLSTLSIGGSVNILDGTAIGLKATYLYGKTQQFTVIDFADAAFIDDEQDRSTFYSAFVATFGVTADIGRVPVLPGELRLGAVVTFPASARTETIHAYRALDTALVTIGSADIPLRLGIGARLQLSERLTTIADLAYQDWSSFGSPAPATLSSALRVSGGIEFMPERGERDFLGRIGYRAGAGYEQSYVSIAGTRITDVFGTFGVSLPIGPGRLNVSARGGVRGTTDRNLQQDTYVTINFGMTTAELWFVDFLED